MSQFATPVPVRLKTLLKRLPPHSRILQIRLGADQASVIIEWENETWQTPFTVPMEISRDALRGKSALPPLLKTPAPWPPTRGQPESCS